MSTTPRAGRPRASSRETLAEAACELFLEQGFEATSIADIALRAGVSRSSFFNYFSSKSDVLWSGLDERIAAFADRLDTDVSTDAASAVRLAVRELGSGFTPDALALAVVHTTAMGLDDELEREAALRRSRIGGAVADRLERGGLDRLAADIRGASWAGAVIAAIEAWARDGAGRSALEDHLDRAAAIAAGEPTGAVRQLRLVVHAPQFDQTLHFYRDVVGMPQAEAYEADGGARVAILDAGRATLEIANAAQVAFIDSVETDGDAPSDRLRVGLEVADAAEAVARLSAGGAEVEASARETPWRSLNARLRTPAGLQVTLFQELDR